MHPSSRPQLRVQSSSKTGKNNTVKWRRAAALRPGAAPTSRERRERAVVHRQELPPPTSRQPTTSVTTDRPTALFHILTSLRTAGTTVVTYLRDTTTNKSL